MKYVSLYKMMKTKTKVSKQLYLKVGLFLFLLVVSEFSFLFGFLEILSFINSTEKDSLYSGIVLLTFFVATMVATLKLRSAWDEFEEIRGVQKKTRVEVFKEMLPTLSLLVFMITFGFIFQWFFGTYLSFEMTHVQTKSVIEQILTINGILLGFFGVILAQTLSAIQNKGNLIYGQIIKSKNDFLLLAYLKEEIKILKRKRIIHVFLVFYSMMPLLASILLAFGELTKIDISQTELLSTQQVIFSPLLATLVGIILLVIVLLQFNLLPDITGTKQKKLDSFD